MKRHKNIYYYLYFTIILIFEQQYDQEVAAHNNNNHVLESLDHLYNNHWSSLGQIFYPYIIWFLREMKNLNVQGDLFLVFLQMQLNHCIRILVV